MPLLNAGRGREKRLDRADPSKDYELREKLGTGSFGALARLAPTRSHPTQAPSTKRTSTAPSRPR